MGVEWEYTWGKDEEIEKLKSSPVPYYLIEIFQFILGIFKGLQAQTQKNTKANISYKANIVECVDLKKSWWYNFWFSFLMSLCGMTLPDFKCNAY